MKQLHTRFLISILVAALLAATFSLPVAAAKSREDQIREQMAANSAAWIIANNAGDYATCEKLHEANVKLAAQLAGSSGNASYDGATGKWTITDSNGNTTTSASSQTGASNNVTYTTTGSSGTKSKTTTTTYSNDSINSYYNAGGTNSGLNTSYNNAAKQQFDNESYRGPEDAAKETAREEANVAKKLLGLTDAQAAKLQSELETTKEVWLQAYADYEEAVETGDTAAAAAAQAEMEKASTAAEELRAGYGYSAKTYGREDGGSFEGGTGGSGGSSGGGSTTPELVRTYSITSSAGSGGSISPAGTVTVNEGEAKTFTISANTGYQIQSVTVDGVNQGAIGTYTFSNVTAAHSISATFAKKTFTITAAAGSGGTISPSGTSTVEYGRSKTFTIIPAAGFEIESVIVDGVNQGAIGTYTFSNVTAAHSISATFRANGEISLPDGLKLTDSEGVDLDGATIKSGYGIFTSIRAEYSGVTGVELKLTYNFGEGNETVKLEETGTKTFELPANPSSPTNKRCVYIPVATPDGTYTITLTMTAKNAAGETLTVTATAQIEVKGNMYEDDFTGNSGRH